MLSSFLIVALPQVLPSFLAFHNTDACISLPASLAFSQQVFSPANAGATSNAVANATTVIIFDEFHNIEPLFGCLPPPSRLRPPKVDVGFIVWFRRTLRPCGDLLSKFFPQSLASLRPPDITIPAMFIGLRPVERLSPRSVT